MADKLSMLREENKRLSRLAEKDWLTGLYNRMAVEERGSEWLKTGKSGTLFVLDMDNFKKINDRYGHIAGDRVLQGIAEVLEKMAFRTDIVGRVGGDEFVIFMPVSQEEAFIESRCRQIEQRFQKLPRPQFVVKRISLTVCGSCYQDGDDYQSLFDRADQKLLQEKAARKRQAETAESGTDDRNSAGITSSASITRGASTPGGSGAASGTTSLKIDIEQISRELSEPGHAEGAFCQDYDSFVCIYRFMERRLKRMHSEVYSILFTLTDGEGDFPSLQIRGKLMETLHECIRTSLRLGDVFTRYSSCQFLVMVCDATAAQSDAIAKRIQMRYEQQCSCAADGGCHLVYNRYPLKPAFSKKEE